MDATHRKEALKAMTEMFYAALFGYDEVKLLPPPQKVELQDVLMF